MFSFVIPCHDNVELLKKVLAGLSLQDGDIDCEVILVDNDSRLDDLNDAYVKYVDRLPLYLVKQPRLPHPMAPCKARNIGLKLAKYEWIVNLDSDCIPNKSYLNSLSRYVKNLDNSIIAGHRVFIDSNNFTDDDLLAGKVNLSVQPEIKSESNYYLTKDRRLAMFDSIHQCEHPWALMHSCNLIYRKEVALKVGGYDELFDGRWGYEDTDFAYRMIHNGSAEPCYLSEIACYHQESISENHEARFNKSSNKNWHLIKERIPGIEAFKKAFYKAINDSIVVD